jgi:hypothetical protein
MEERCPKCKSTNIEGLPRAHYMSEHNPLENINRAPDQYKCKESDCNHEWRIKK